MNNSWISALPTNQLTHLLVINKTAVIYNEEFHIPENHLIHWLH